jgi:hypothetical protein
MKSVYETHIPKMLRALYKSQIYPVETVFAVTNFKANIHFTLLYLPISVLHNVNSCPIKKSVFFHTLVTDSNRAVPSPMWHSMFAHGASFADTSPTITTVMQSDLRSKLNLAAAAVCNLMIGDPI